MRRTLLRVLLCFSLCAVCLLFIIGLSSRMATAKRIQAISASGPGIKYIEWGSNIGAMPVPRIIDRIFSPGASSSFVRGVRFESSFTDFPKLQIERFPEIEYLEIDNTSASPAFARMANKMPQLDRIYVSNGFLSAETLEGLGKHPNKPVVIFELCDFDSIDFDGEYVPAALELGVRCEKHPRHK